MNRFVEFIPVPERPRHGNYNLVQKCLRRYETSFKEIYINLFFVATGHDLRAISSLDIPPRDLTSKERDEWIGAIKEKTSWSYLLRESFIRAI
jgi:hypothetical protein